MNLNEIMENLESKMSDTNRLKAEQAQKEQTLYKVCNSNYEKIFLPRLKELEDFSLKLSGLTKDLICEGTSVRDTFAICRNYARFNYGFTTTNNIYEISFGKLFDLIKECPWHNGEKEKLFNHCVNFFRSEDKTLETLHKIELLYAKGFQKQADELDKINTKLAEDIRKMTELLKDSHAVEENSDGTIEITLNGKIYIGTVKEQ